MAYWLKCPAPGPSKVTVFVCVCLFFMGETQLLQCLYPFRRINQFWKTLRSSEMQRVNLVMDKHPIQWQLGGRNDGTSNIPIHCSLLNLG